jgi:hypothetical protein
LAEKQESAMSAVQQKTAAQSYQPPVLATDAILAHFSNHAGRAGHWWYYLSWNDYRVVSQPLIAGQDAYTHTVSDPDPAQTVVTPKPDAAGMYRFTSFGFKVHLDLNKTWVLDGKLTPSLLSHEEGHFFISGAKAVDCCNKILTTAAGKSKTDLTKEAQKLIADYSARAVEINTAYDDRTSHGSKAAKQLIWKEAIYDMVKTGLSGFDDLYRRVKSGQL